MKVAIACVLGLGLIASPLHAKTLSDAIKECGQVQNSLKRLVCYDGIARDISQFDDLSELMNVPAPIPAPSAQVPATTPVAPDASQSSDKETFGLPKPQGSDLDNVVDGKMYAILTMVEDDPYGKKVLTLDGKQVWKQMDSGKINLQKDDKVYVEEGMLGSYYLSREDINKRIRVKRIK